MRTRRPIVPCVHGDRASRELGSRTAAAVREREKPLSLRSHNSATTYERIHQDSDEHGSHSIGDQTTGTTVKIPRALCHHYPWSRDRMPDRRENPVDRRTGICFPISRVLGSASPPYLLSRQASQGDRKARGKQIKVKTLSRSSFRGTSTAHFVSLSSGC